jgi:hypothetical protein
LVPVGLGVGGVGNSEVLSLSANRPSGLSDPDRLAADGTLGVVESLVEERSTLVNAVVLGVLEVWVGINTDPVTSIDNSIVGSVNPSRPGIDVTKPTLLRAEPAIAVRTWLI